MPLFVRPPPIAALMAGLECKPRLRGDALVLFPQAFDILPEHAAADEHEGRGPGERPPALRERRLLKLGRDDFAVLELPQGELRGLVRIDGLVPLPGDEAGDGDG